MSDYATSCENLCSVIDCLEIGIVVLDTDGCVQHWNRWLATRSGISAEQALDQPLSTLFPEQSNTRLQVAIKHAIQDRLPSLLSPALHGTLLPLYVSANDRRKEKRMHQLIHVLPLRDEQRRAACVIQISDMTANISRERLLRQQAENLRRTTAEDALTRIANRLKFDEVVASEFHKAQTQGLPISLVIADIDRFQDYNAIYGRDAGNKALEELASIARDMLRPGIDFVARYSGDEFAFILPRLSQEETCHFAENLRLRVLARNISNESSTIAKQLTISIGTTVMTPGIDADTHTLISSADVALYQAKHEGRNQAILFSADDGSFKNCN